MRDVNYYEIKHNKLFFQNKKTSLFQTNLTDKL